MEKDFEYQEQTIIALLSKLYNAHIELSQCRDFPEDYEENALDEYIFQLKFISDALYGVCLAYFDQKNIPSYTSYFIKKVEPYYKDDELLIQDYSDPEDNSVYSELFAIYYNILVAFPAFNTSKSYFKGTGFIYLEYILKSTGFYLKSIGINPKNEAEIYNKIKLILEVVFPDIPRTLPHFQRKGGVYSPDLAVPSLNCAIEYKLVDSMQKLNTALDEVYVDSNNYVGHSKYSKFYAVFYSDEVGLCMIEKFNDLWKEKKFPDNWKGIYVEGPQRANKIYDAIV